MRLDNLLKFAFRALGGHPLRAGLSLLGVAIGVASVILLISIGEAARTYIIDEFASLGANLLVVIPGRTETSGLAPLISETTRDLTIQDAEVLERRIPSVRRVAPVVAGNAELQYAGRSRRLMVLGTTAAFLPLRGLSMGSGRFLPAGSGHAYDPVCVIGTTVKKELFPDISPVGKLLGVGDYRFRIIGVLASSGTTLGMDVDDIVLVPAATALKMFNRSSLFRIMVEVSAHSEIERTKGRVISVIKDRHGGEEDITIITQDAVMSTLSQILSVLTAALVGIAAISLSVAGIGIMNVMLVTVSERRPEVGLLKAVGVRPGQIVAVFLAEATLLALLGGLMGLGFGLGLAELESHFFPAFPLVAPWWAILLALLVSAGVGITFGSLPARRAAALDPIEALARR